jgi:hypothetical protein
MSAAAMHRGEKARTEKRIMSYGWATSSLSLSLPDTGKLFSYFQMTCLRLHRSPTTIIRERNHLLCKKKKPPAVDENYLLR